MYLASCNPIYSIQYTPQTSESLAARSWNLQNKHLPNKTELGNRNIFLQVAAQLCRFWGNKSTFHNMWICCFWIVTSNTWKKKVPLLDSIFLKITLRILTPQEWLFWGPIQPRYTGSNLSIGGSLGILREGDLSDEFSRKPAENFHAANIAPKSLRYLIMHSGHLLLLFLAHLGWSPYSLNAPLGLVGFYMWDPLKV